MAKKVENYLEHTHGDADPVNHYKPTLKEDMEQAKKNKEAAEERLQQMLVETAERYWLEEDEVEDFLCENYEDKESCEYLVDGAILTCTNCTKEIVEIEDKKTGKMRPYEASIDMSIDYSVLTDDDDTKVLGRLKVTENHTANSNGLMHATIKDRIRGKNIPSFGNCLRGPDCVWEEDIFQKFHDEGDTKKRGGTCQYLMRLESEWENYEIGQHFQSFDDDVEGNKTGITMTSMLFCKHGGFIYPVTSGQDKVSMSKLHAIKILERYMKEGKYDEEEVESALVYLAGQSSYILAFYDFGDNNDYNKFDNYILGWVEYYAETTGVMMDPRIIKSQVYEESAMGYTSWQSTIPVANSSTDVMQALDIRNGNIYEYIGISLSNFEAITSDGKYKTGSWFWQVNLGAKGEPEPKANSYNQDKVDRCGGIIRSLFNTEKDGSGECYIEGSNKKYFYLNEKVTAIMSIGMGLDKMQGLLQENNMNYAVALKKYNVAKPNYASNILNRVKSIDGLIL